MIWHFKIGGIKRFDTISNFRSNIYQPENVFSLRNRRRVFAIKI